MIVISRLATGMSWGQMSEHIGHTSVTGFQRIFKSRFASVADCARHFLPAIADFADDGEFKVCPNAIFIVIAFDMPLIQPGMRSHVSAFTRYATQSSLYGDRFAFRAHVAMSPRGRLAPLGVGLGRDNSGHVMQTSPDILKALTRNDLVVDDNQPAVQQSRYCFLYDVNVGSTGIRETYPNAMPMRLNENARTRAELARNAQMTETIALAKQWKHHLRDGGSVCCVRA